MFNADAANSQNTSKYISFIDGVLHPVSEPMEYIDNLNTESNLPLIPVQVKQSRVTSQRDIENFVDSMKIKERSRGIFVSFGFSKAAHRAIAELSSTEGMDIVALTVQEILAQGDTGNN